jgi:upstream-binding transcription factor
MDERPGINNSTLTAMISVKWKVIHFAKPIVFAEVAGLLAYKSEVSDFVICVLLGLQELNEEERQIWNSKAAEAMEAYKKELEEYSKSLAAATSNDKQQQ